MCGPSEPIKDENPVLGIFNSLAGQSMSTACDLLPWR